MKGEKRSSEISEDRKAAIALSDLFRVEFAVEAHQWSRLKVVLEHV